MGWLLGALGIGGLGAAALIFIPGAAANALRALGAALDVVRRNPWQCAVLALLLACGLLWRGWNHADDETAVQVAGRAADRKAVADAQVEAARLAIAAKAATEARYRANAERIDHAHETQLADARSDVDRYIADHRVRAQGVAGSRGGTPATADNRDPGVLAGLPANYVPVAESDLRACAAATAYALSAREWALGLAN